MQKRLIVALSIGLGASLLAIAFLAGRITAPTPTAVVIEPKPARAAQPPPVPPPNIEPTSAEVSRDTPASLSPHAPFVAGESVAPVAQVHQLVALSPSPAIAAYFAKIDAIHSAGSGDPTTFAQGIVGGLQAGDASGIDSLATNAKTALAQARAVQPPAPCAEYHRRLLESLSESITGIESLRSALKSGDISVLASLTSQFQNSQQKVDELDRMRKQLLGQ